MADLMDSPRLIRNVAIAGHLHHGKVLYTHTTHTHTTHTQHTHTHNTHTHTVMNNIIIVCIVLLLDFISG